ncbi:diacylglycerol kinase delta-like isoform X2 [Paramacrobiotus metropolitanus]|uniref:diacylglycerol kinase delta-like isoform X2 n=1 Tax=Paramacrobiotus metropolitanus TaxID=2943436 RepID=UPI0024458CB1|nr:diacylglycerol kinase delta-like isoform X2 [Paramacrobiotus metropolitanus]
MEQRNANLTVSTENEESSISAPRCSDSDSSDSENETESGGKNFHRRVSTNRTLKNSVVVKEGWLLKQTTPFQRLHRRYFKLQGKKLYYAKDPNSAIFEEIPLTDISLAEHGEKNANNVFQLISPFQNLILCAEKRRDMEEWITALKAVSSREYYDVAEQVSLFSGQHNWYICSHARPTYCNICREVLSGVASRGLSCEVCKFKAHKRCAVKAPNNCKWTTLASMGQENIIEDPDGTIHMRHQWLEGNLTVSAKCSVCERTCGSVLRLQDWRCQWCKAMVHTQCLNAFPERCALLPACRFSTVPPTLFNHCENDVVCVSDPLGSAVSSRRYSPQGLSPLLVFGNSKSGDNQGVKFLRRFKQTLNPAQVFDLMQSGTTLGLQLFKKFDSFRVLVCGGDGSVGWVLQDLDAHNLLRKCQVGILPLGTGNDLARVLGWGSTCDADTPLASLLEKYEWASSKLLDRWSIMEYYDSLPLPATPSPPAPHHRVLLPNADPIAAYEDSVASHLSRIILSEEECEVIQSARVLCETIKDFVAKVGAAFAQDERDHESMSRKCQVLNEKLDRLLDTLHHESEATAAVQVAPVAGLPVPADATPSRSGSVQRALKTPPSDRRRAFIQQDVILSRANSLKKAVRQIIEHTEKAVDEQNALRVPRVLARGQSRSAENVIQAMPESVPGGADASGSQDTIFNFPPHPPAANDFLKNSPLDLASPSSVLHSGGRAKSGRHPWITSPPLTQPIPHVKRGLMTNVATGTSLITRVLLANADALSKIGSPTQAHSRENISLEAFSERCVMNNYFGVGLDAKIALEFHQKREEHPEKCRSRTKNMMWYGVLGVKELQKRTYHHLERIVQLECDGQPIPLPSLQGIVVLNIPSYMGGANFWGGVKGDDLFRAPAFDDRMLEVVAVFGTVQMAVSKVIRIQHHRIAQCRSVKIIIKGLEGIPVQVDGEAWIQPPGCIHIVHKNKAQMLCRDRQFESAFKIWQQQQLSLCPLSSKNNCDVNCGPAMLSERELQLIQDFVRVCARLIRSVKLAAMACPEIEDDIAHSVIKASESLDHLTPYGRLTNIPNIKFVASRLLNSIRELRDEASELLRAKPTTLVLPADTALELQAAVNEVDQYVQMIVDAGLAVVCDDPDSSRDNLASTSTGSAGTVGELGRTFRSRFLGRFQFRRGAQRPPEGESQYKYPSLSVREWTSEDVALWLHSLHLGEYKDVFISHDIRGNELIHLERRDLKDLGITKVGHLKRIQQAIRDLILNVSDSSAL